MCKESLKTKRTTEEDGPIGDHKSDSVVGRRRVRIKKKKEGNSIIILKR